MPATTAILRHSPLSCPMTLSDQPISASEQQKSGPWIGFPSGGQRIEQKVDLRDVQVHLEGDTAIVNYLITVRKGWGKTESSTTGGERRFSERTARNGLPSRPTRAIFQLTTSSQSKSTPRFSRTTRGTMTGPVTASTTGIRSLSRTVTCSANGGGVKSKCLAKGKDTFFQPDDSGWWTFVRDRQGHVTGYIYYYPEGWYRRFQSQEWTSAAHLFSPNQGPSLHSPGKAHRYIFGGCIRTRLAFVRSSVLPIRRS